MNSDEFTSDDTARTTLLCSTGLSFNDVDMLFAADFRAALGFLVPSHEVLFRFTYAEQNLSAFVAAMQLHSARSVAWWECFVRHAEAHIARQMLESPVAVRNETIRAARNKMMGAQPPSVDLRGAVVVGREIELDVDGTHIEHFLLEHTRLGRR